MAGIYIHIPFCKQACHYCNFHFSTSLQFKDELIAALIKEIHLSPTKASKPTEKEFCETIYFGGGTPSLLTALEVGSILKEIQAFQIIKVKFQD